MNGIRRNFLKLTSVVLSVIMMLSVTAIAPITANAASTSDYEYEILDDDFVAITKYKGSVENLAIPEKIGNYYVGGINHNAFRDNTKLKSVSIPECASYIDENAFADCVNLKDIYIGSHVTSIGINAFINTAFYKDNSNWVNGALYLNRCLIKYNSSASEYRIADGTITIADNACSGMRSLLKCYLPDSLRTIGIDAFSSGALVDINIPSSVYSIGEDAFFNNIKLKELVIPNSVKYLGRAAFGCCNSLENVTLPDTIEYIPKQLFTNCDKLKNIKLPESVKYIDEYAFNGTGLESITIPKSVEYISPRAFCSCDKISKVDLPDKLIEIDSETFLDSKCYKNSDNWSNGVFYLDGYAMQANDNENSIAIKSGTKYIASNFCGYNSSVSKLTIPASVKGIAPFAFLDCWYLGSVSIPPTVNEIGAGAFGIVKQYGDYYKLADFKITCVKNTAGYDYAKEYGFAIVDGGKASAVSLNAKNITLGAGETYKLNSTLTPSFSTSSCTWSSNSTSVATVNSSGKVTAKKAGTATITVKTSSGKTATCKVTVKPAPTSIKINPQSLTLGKGENYTISESTNSGSWASVFTWSSSNTNVATVEKTSGNKAKVVAKGEGTATITIKTYNGKTSTCKVTVKPAPTSATLAKSSLTMGKGEQLIITEKTNSGSWATNFTWSSSNTNVLTVTKTTGNKANIVAKGVGTATITFKTYNGKTATCVVTVKNAPSSVSLQAKNITLGLGESYDFNSTVNGGAGSYKRSYSSSNTSVATVNSSGVITTKKAGTANITVTTFNGKTSTCKVTVKSAPKSVKLGASSLSMGNGEKVIITESTNSGSWASNFTWSSSNTDVATVTKTTGNKAEIVGLSEGTAVISFTTYNGVKADCVVTVKKAPEKISLQVPEMTLKVGQTYDFNSYVNGGAGSFKRTYSTSNSSVATVNSSGVITTKKAGTAVITVTAFNGVKGSCTVTVVK